MANIEIEERIISLRKENYNNIEIAELLKLHKKTVGTILKKYGLNYTAQEFKEERKCLKCSNVFIVNKKDAKRFCSRSCSASFFNEKRRKNNKYSIRTRQLQEYRIKYPDLKGSDFRTRIIEDELLEKDWSTLGFDRKRKRVLLEQHGKCNRCGINNWLGKPIVLEIDHIDGDNTNNTRDNLEAVCPNCHSITDTWRGKNRKDRKYVVSSLDFVAAFNNNAGNVRQALLSLGLTAKGGNYSRLYYALDLNKIEYCKQSKRKK